jgi:hypothetical protein
VPPAARASNARPRDQAGFRPRHLAGFHLPCLPTSLRLVDAARGLVAYTLSGKLHLLRLRGGRKGVLATATYARFGDTGLFYTYTASGPHPGRNPLRSLHSLPVQP